MSDELFHVFANEMSNLMEESIVTYKDQEMLLKKLFDIESKFKKELLRTKRGIATYKKFLDFILDERSNILASRIYFRERQNTFSSKIVKCFYSRNAKALTKFRVNYWFASWVINNNIQTNKKLRSLFYEMKAVRTQLCETNIPLAINRAKIFWVRVPRSQLEYMDLIQSCTEGLISAIDKFVPPYRTVFRSTAIGRMVSNMIGDYNSTMVKMSPKERRIIYRAKNAVNKEKLQSFPDILKYVQQSFPDVTKIVLERLLTASSLPSSVSDPNIEVHQQISGLTSDDDVESNAIHHDLSIKLYEHLSNLTTLEKKLIMLTYGKMLVRGLL